MSQRMPIISRGCNRMTHFHLLKPLGKNRHISSCDRFLLKPTGGKTNKQILNNWKLKRAKRRKRKIWPEYGKVHKKKRGLSMFEERFGTTLHEGVACLGPLLDGPSYVTLFFCTRHHHHLRRHAFQDLRATFGNQSRYCSTASSIEDFENVVRAFQDESSQVHVRPVSQVR